jgi:prepilin peptidase CpaA
MLFAAWFILLISIAIVLDATKLTIPNWISVGLVIGFILYCFAGAEDIQVWQHVLVGAAVLIIAAGLYLMRWMGGGDVKILAAIALWAGPLQILPFLLLTTLFGAAIAVAMLAVHLWVLANAQSATVIAAKRYIPRWVHHGLCPYGIAIGTAALIIIPSRFF